MDVNEVIILEDTDKKKTIPTVEEYNNICRICLINLNIPGLKKHSINETTDQIKILSLLENYTPIKLPMNDKLPQNLCSKCVDYLIDIHIFHSRCLLNEDLLHKIWIKSQRNIIVQTNQHHNYSINPNGDNQQNYTNIPDNIQNNQTNLFLADNVKNIIKSINDELMGIHRCKSCPEEFSSEQALKEHRKTVYHSKTPTCPCQYCGRKFSSSKLKEHIRTHTKEKPFQCDQCETAFSIRTNLIRHKRIHSTDKPVCEICGKQFSTPETLSLHWKTHNNDKVFTIDEETHSHKCGICKKLFETYNEMETHLKKQHARTHICSICGKDFPFNSQLVKHMRNHTGERPFECTVCSKSFTNMAVLKQHQVTHVTERAFECESCHKRFKSKTYLSVHMKTHKMHAISCVICVVCNKPFRTKVLLALHMRTHTGDRNYECNLCHKRFRQHAHLSTHLHLHSGKQPHACEYCGKAFALKGNLTVHLRIHTGERPYVCRVCGMGFMDASTRKKHEKTQHRHIEFEYARDGVNLKEEKNITKGEELEDYEDVQESGDAIQAEEFLAYDNVEESVDVIEAQEDLSQQFVILNEPLFTDVKILENV